VLRSLPVPPFIGAVVVVIWGIGCGGASAGRDGQDETDAAGAGGLSTARSVALAEPLAEDLGRRLHGLYRGEPETTVVLPPAELAEILVPRAAERLADQPRLDLGPAVADGDPLGGARYLGVCIQGARLEPAEGPLGLRRDRWVVDRALVVGLRPGRRRVAAWVEGIFVQTVDGYRAIALQRLERPRWEHSDLDLAPCDMGSGRWDPQYIGSVTE
jgi:hypothetical protein